MLNLRIEDRIYSVAGILPEQFAFPAKTDLWVPSELDPERRGLAAPRPSGGQDPDPDATAHSERRYLWLLVLMIALIVGITTLVGIVGMIVVAFGGST